MADTVRTTLGPRGMDKLISDGRKVTISNDGATIMKLLDVEHPAAKTLVDISMSQDAEVGDGTTSVVLLAGEILKQLKPFVEEGVHPQIIMRSIQAAGKLAVKKVQELCVPFDTTTDEGSDMLLKCASTALNSKLIASHQDLFSPMVVSAVRSLHEAGSLDDLDSLVAINRIPGGKKALSALLNCLSTLSPHSRLQQWARGHHRGPPPMVLLCSPLH